MVKYSKASKCEVSLAVKSQKLMLEIKDNGKGYDGSTKGGGAGLKNMHKRAEEMNGTFEIGTGPGKGTLIRLSIPRSFTTKNLG